MGFTLATGEPMTTCTDLSISQGIQHFLFLKTIKLHPIMHLFKVFLGTDSAELA